MQRILSLEYFYKYLLKILKLTQKSQKYRLGSGPDDGEEVFAHKFIADSGIDRKELLFKNIIDEFYAVVTDTGAATLVSATVDEPISALYPEMSIADLESKLEAEFTQ